jgi:hypothetical protein
MLAGPSPSTTVARRRYGSLLGLYQIVDLADEQAIRACPAVTDPPDKVGVDAQSFDWGCRLLRFAAGVTSRPRGSEEPGGFFPFKIVDEDDLIKCVKRFQWRGSFSALERDAAFGVFLG